MDYTFTDADKVRDDKYVVFKRDEYTRWFQALQAGSDYDVDLPRYIPDAVVIRTQDVFAGPALHSYASSISVAARLMHDDKDLQEIADYFHHRAVEADEGPRKLPD